MSKTSRILMGNGWYRELYGKTLNKKEAEAFLAKVVLGNYIVRLNSATFHLIGSIDIRSDRHGFNYGAYGSDTMYSIHFDSIPDDLVILTPEEAELAKVLYDQR